jgi:hypothetical protein
MEITSAPSLLGLTREELLAARPELILHEDRDEIQEGDAYAYATHPDEEFEAVLGADGRVDTVFVYRQSPLLEGLGFDFDARRGDILARFGRPERSGVQEIDTLLGPQGAWDRFLFPDYFLHLQYVYDSDRLKLVTIMTLQVVSGIGDGSATE